MARRVGAWLRETRALLTQARHLKHDVRASHRIGLGPTVVFLHGLYATAGVWRPLRQRFEEQLQASTHALSYLPGPGVQAMTERLATLIADIREPANIHLVGHSFGGLVMRNYVCCEDCDPRVVTTTSLAAPFLGSLKNGWVPGQGGRDLLPTAEILLRLRTASKENLRVPHLSLCAVEDRLIVPGAFPEYGQHVLIPETGHNGILFHEEAMKLVLDRVASFVAAS